MNSKLKFFIIRTFPMLIMFTLLSVSALLSIFMTFCNLNYNYNDLINLPMITGDFLLPILLFTGALHCRNRTLAICAVISCFIGIFWRLGAILMYRETFMTFEYSTIKLLAAHTNFESLQAFVGKYFYYWLIPLLAAVISLITYCCIAIWKTLGKASRTTSKKALVVSGILLTASVISNIVYIFFSLYYWVENLSARPFPVALYHSIKEITEDIHRGNKFVSIPIQKESLAKLRKMGIVAPEKEKVIKRDLFDRIIIIAVESLDYNYLSRNNPEMPANITPNLDRMSAQYVSMENYFGATIPTSYALTSLVLSRMDYKKDQHIPVESMFCAARKKGFYSFYFTSAMGNLDENRRFFKQMFQPDIQLFRKELMEIHGIHPESSWSLSDRSLFSCALKELKKCPSNRFIAVISTMDTHFPYYNSPLSPEEEKVFNTPFLRALHSTDREVNDFVNKIMEDPNLYNERTLIILTADHTSTLGENYTKRPNYYPERIPLIFISKNQEIFKKLNTKKYASSIDLAPTILNMIDAEIPSTFMGRDLFSDKQIAITMPYMPYIIVHSAEGEYRFFLNNAKGEEQTAIRDYFYFFYGK